MTVRAQAHTLEAVAAGLVMLSGVAFALQIAAVTPLTGSTSNQHIENQQAYEAESLLDAEAANGSLARTLRYWDADAGRFHGATGGGYTGGGPPTAFGTALDEVFLERGVAYNVNVRYVVPGENGSLSSWNTSDASVGLVNLGEPTEHATVATRLVTLRDDDRLLDAAGDPTGPRLGEVNESYFAPDAAPDSGLYGVFEIEVVLWRI